MVMTICIIPDLTRKVLSPCFTISIWVNSTGELKEERTRELVAGLGYDGAEVDENNNNIPMVWYLNYFIILYKYSLLHQTLLTSDLN